MNEKLRIRTKVGDAEFDAEGPAEIVKEQFDRFWRAAYGRSAPDPGRERTAPPAPTKEFHFEDEGLLRVFATRNRVLALRSTEGVSPTDAAILLLYGYLKAGSVQVTGATLLKSMRESGIESARIDRLYDEAVGMVQSEGQRRGKRYRLTDAGKERAEALSTMVEPAP